MHKRETYNRKKKHKNDWDEGERRRGKSRKETEDAKIRKAVKKELKKKEQEEAEKQKPVTHSYRPQSLRPPEKLKVTKPVHRTPEEIRLIKEDISRRFREGLKNEHGSTEEAD